MQCLGHGPFKLAATTASMERFFNTTGPVVPADHYCIAPLARIDSGDVRDCRIRSGSTQEIMTGGSAFNVKAASRRLGNFVKAEVYALLGQHRAGTGQTFTEGASSAVTGQHDSRSSREISLELPVTHTPPEEPLHDATLFICHGCHPMYLCALAFILSLIFSGLAVAAIPVEHFARLPAFSAPAISPKGSKIAATMTTNGEESLYLMELNPEGSPLLQLTRKIQRSDALFFQKYRWVNEEILLSDIRTTVKWRGSLRNATRLLLIPSDRNQEFRFIEAKPNKWGRPKQHSELIHLLPQDKDHILVAVDEDDDARYFAPEVHKVNVNSGKKYLVQRNIRVIFDWISDSTGNLRVGVAFNDLKGDTDQVVYYRHPGDNFEVLSRNQYFDDERLYPVGFEKGNDDILLMEAQEYKEESEEEPRVLRFDVKAKTVLGPYSNEREDKILEQIKAELEGFDIHVASKSMDENQYIYRLNSDVEVPMYVYHNIGMGFFKQLPSPYPELNGQKFSPMLKVSYNARDGLKIPAFLTLPRGKEAAKELPTIIYPHGGPWSHDDWGFDPRVQFFADRGYAVLQPQFRGSTGYGKEHEEAGYEQWGLKIQDDITDGVKWMIDKGIADPDRICIVGASFGGYAAAMGLAKTPELYRCGISIAAVLDLKKLIDDQNDLLFSGINKAIINKKKDSRPVSPYHLADNIQAPLLLIHGDKDTIVPFEHSKKMHRALKKRKKNVELIKLEGAEHWSTTEVHELTKLGAIEAFLSKHLNP